jgi:hypothetical protein
MDGHKQVCRFVGSDLVMCAREATHGLHPERYPRCEEHKRTQAKTSWRNLRKYFRKRSIERGLGWVWISDEGQCWQSHNTWSGVQDFNVDEFRPEEYWRNNNWQSDDDSFKNDMNKVRELLLERGITGHEA